MNLLVTGAWVDGKEHIEKLKELGHCVIYMQYEQDELPCDYEWVEGVICNGLFLHYAIEKFVNLRYIQLTSAGYDRVPMEYVKSHMIEIHNAGDVYAIPMAEFAVAGVLQLYKKLHFFSENQKQRKWEKHRGLLELYGKKVCIVGCGNVGTECAKRFKAFGCKVIGVNRSRVQNKVYDRMIDIGVLDDALRNSDIIVLAIAYTKETYHLINSVRLNNLKSSAVLVNISRGAIVDTEALLNVINDIGGAVLDVFEEEPLNKSSRLWKCENVIISPHNSFVGDNNSNRLYKMVISNLF